MKTKLIIMIVVSALVTLSFAFVDNHTAEPKKNSSEKSTKFKHDSSLGLMSEDKM